MHSAAWEKMFDDYLRLRQEKYGGPFKEFTHEKDYLPYVDGKPRYKGVVSAELNLKGKPEPDIFTTACDNLEIEYKKAIVVEDAVSGVQAGAKGNFGLILGIARENNENELMQKRG